VKRSEWSNEYLIDWADGILSSAMNLSPQTVDKRHNDLLKISSSGSLDLKIYLSDEAKRIKKNQMETAFYPKTYKVNQRAKEIQVVGEMLVYLGRDKAPLALKKSFCVSYVKSPSGMILLSGLKEEKNS
jgi:conjugal transfer pilus assembly protein TraE